MSDEDSWSPVRYQNPYTLQKAEDFFANFDGVDSPPKSWVKNPKSIRFSKQDNFVKGRLLDTCYKGRIFRFDTNALLLIQFLRPQVWRIRFDEKNASGTDFTNYNTRAIVQDTATALIQKLDHAEEIEWDVELVDTDENLVLMSVIKEKKLGAPQEYIRAPCVKLWIQKNPFKITATRLVNRSPSVSSLPTGKASGLYQTLSADKNEAVIWQTKECGLKYGTGSVVLSIQRTSTARFVGFGEQGGSSFIKDQSYMNCFDFDNMRYNNIYGRGPACNSEPLYHSDPYFIEANANPFLTSQIGTFIDNHSQVCLDVGRLDRLTIRLATRFNSFAGLFFAGDNIQDIITLFTSIVGRPALMPRYVLGYHQGCYGYDTRQKVEDIVDQYRHYGYPIDGMHIDVDIQDNYRTCTIDSKSFPDPISMFRSLRSQGIKCSTKIPPMFANVPRDWHSTLHEGLSKGYFVMNDRDLDSDVDMSDHVRYVQDDNGTKSTTNPSNVDTRNTFNSGQDEYNLTQSFNTKTVPLHGGVDDEGNKGSPGHYFNLNDEEARQWWGQQYGTLFDSGLEFVWQDMTSSCMGRNYGDMKSWPFRLLLDADGWSGDPRLVDNGNKAIEIRSLYSSNLHRATVKGLNQVESRKGKRNFIIGRGNFTGTHKYVGFWTRDNSSTWESFIISIAQVLSNGLSGVTIGGADVGGFEPADLPSFCDPELFIRWNIAYALLPWYRNHYTRKGKKLFQEPWAYEEFARGSDWDKMKMPANDRPLYRAVHPIVRYYIRLRYSLMQLMYDAMYENMLNGLPIARAMIITDPLDSSLFGQNEIYTRAQYLVGHNLLHAPAVIPKESVRKLYLPAPNYWYALNLRVFDNDTSLGAPLKEKVVGGSYVHYTASIDAVWHRDEDRLIAEQLPYVTPMYVREGAIIPQIPVLDFVPDRNEPEQTDIKTPITLHIYPGRAQSVQQEDMNPYRYDMYLDDGVSRESAPEDTYLTNSADIGQTNPARRKRLRDKFRADAEARSIFTHIKIVQTIQRNSKASNQRKAKFERRLVISSSWDHYTQLKRDFGDSFRVVFWHEPKTKLYFTNLASVKDTVVVEKPYHDTEANATVVRVPIFGSGPDKSLTISVPYERED